MHHTDGIELGKVLPGVDLALWLQLIVAAVLVVAVGAWALTAL
jgi:hypothetical protein